MRADLDPGRRHLTQLGGREQGLARSLWIPGIVGTEQPGRHEHRGAEPEALQHRQGIFGEIRVPVVEGEADQAVGGTTAMGIEKLPHGSPPAARPAQPAHLLVEPLRAHRYVVRIVLIR